MPTILALQRQIYQLSVISKLKMSAACFCLFSYVGWLILSLQEGSWPQTSPNPHLFASNSYVSKDRKPQTRLCRRVMHAQSCSILFDPMNHSPLGPSWGKFHEYGGKNTGVGCHFLLPGIFSIQGSNLHLLQWQADSLPRSHLWSPTYTVLDTEMKDVHSSLTPKINSHFTLHCSQSCALLSYLLNPIPLFSCWICYDKITKISPNDLSMTATNSVDLTELREFSLLTESNDSWAGHTPLHGSGSNRDSFSSGLFNVQL